MTTTMEYDTGSIVRHINGLPVEGTVERSSNGTAQVRWETGTHGIYPIGQLCLVEPGDGYYRRATTAATIVTDHEWEPSIEGTTACELCGRRPGDHQYSSKFNTPGNDTTCAASITLGQILDALTPLWDRANDVTEDGTFVRPEYRQALEDAWARIVESCELRRISTESPHPILNVAMTRRER